MRSPDLEFIANERLQGLERLPKLEDSLDGEDVVPNFNLPLSELFQELSF